MDLPYYWSNKTWCKVSILCIAPTSSNTAALSCRAAPPIFAPTPISSALFSDYSHDPTEHVALVAVEAADCDRARRLRSAHRADRHAGRFSHALYFRRGDRLYAAGAAGHRAG